MAQPCLSCIHPRRSAIDRALASSGELNALSKRFGVSAGSLRRHRQNHLAEQSGEVPQAVAGSQVTSSRGSEFVEVAVAPSVAAGSQVEIELCGGSRGASLRLRGYLDPEALHALARAVTGDA